jgi:Na+/melibiose symporter-like transporter
MIANSELLADIMRLALTTAALTIPAISVAYFISSQTEEEIERMSKVIGFGSISAIILVACSLVTFVVLCFGYENEQASLLISGVLFGIGMLLLLYVLFVLAGFKREIPRVRRNEPAIEPTTQQPQTPQP